jgi:hypothetical protein
VSEERCPRMYNCYACASPRERLTRMIVCPDCGNKRCPRGTDHRLDCTRSNEPEQPGSRYAEGWVEPEVKDCLSVFTAPGEECRACEGVSPTPDPAQHLTARIAALEGALREIRTLERMPGKKPPTNRDEASRLVEQTLRYIDQVAAAALGEEEG